MDPAPRDARAGLRCAVDWGLFALTLLSTGAVLGFSFLSASGTLTGYKIGAIAQLYESAIAPASWALRIWAVIYFLSALLSVAQFISLVVPIETLAPGGWMRATFGVKKDLVLRKVAPFWAAASVGNICWIVFFTLNTSAWTFALSSATIFALLAALVVIYVNTKAWHALHTERDSILEVLVIEVLISMYTGWVAVACILSSAVTFIAFGWRGAPWTETGWVCVILTVAALVEALNLATRRDPIFAAVFSMSAAAIGARNGAESVAVLIVSVLLSVLFGCGALVAAVAHSVKAVRRWRARPAVGDARTEDLLEEPSNP